MLDLSGIHAGYGSVQVLSGASMDIKPGEVVCLMGRNGAGKTTLAKVVMGIVRASAGRMVLDGKSFERSPAHAIPKLGIGYVPQGRRLFAGLSVRENLEIGRMTRNTPEAVIDEVLELFPKLAERLDQRAGTLSGGEQQMLATGRALCLQPKLMILDEPTEGLQPSIVRTIREAIVGLREKGTSVFLVEQRVGAVLGIADRVSFMEHGVIQETVPVAELTPASPQFRKYVGISQA